MRFGVTLKGINYILNMQNILLTIQIITSLILIILILVQSKGSGLGRAWGGGSSHSFTRRGVEKLLFRLTFFVTAIFIGISIITLIF